jgi:rod shape-determining protein MreC
VTVQPSGQQSIMSGDNSDLPPLEFLEDPDEVRPGDRVVSSGDGGMFPAGLLVGTVVLGTDKRLRVAMAADYQRLEFLRVLRSHELTPITDPGALLADPPLQGPPAPSVVDPSAPPEGGSNG